MSTRTSSLRYVLVQCNGQGGFYKHPFMLNGRIVKYTSKVEARRIAETASYGAGMFGFKALPETALYDHRRYVPSSLRI